MAGGPRRLPPPIAQLKDVELAGKAEELTGGSSAALLGKPSHA
jgi:hypothetical protein